MKPIIKILLFTSNPATRHSISHFIDTQDDCQLVGVTDELRILFDMIYSKSANALIMDLEDSEDNTTNIEFIKALQSCPPEIKPFTLVTTDILHFQTVDAIHVAGTDFVMSKLKPDYSIQNMFDLLHLVIEKPITPCISHHDYYPRMLRIIYSELDEVGICHSLSGYQYLAEAILLYMEGRQLNICAILGDYHRKSTSSIHQCMQNAIDCAWVKPKETLSLTLEYVRKTQILRRIPTVNQFIRLYAEKIKNM